MSAGIKISIVTSVKDGQPFFQDALSSITAQSYENWEHIIVDAGSRDGSLERAKSAAEMDRRVHVFERPGEPLYASLDWGLSQTEGEIIAWLNADDLYTPWAFEIIAQHFEENGTNWITGLPGCWDSAGRLRFVRPQAWYPQKWIAKGYFHLDGLGFLQQESMFFAKSLFTALSANQRALFREQKLAGDFLLWKLFAERSPLMVIPSVIGGFRKHANNISVINIEDYMAEARSLGAKNLPFPGRAFYRRLYLLAAAARQLSVVGQYDISVSNQE